MSPPYCSRKRLQAALHFCPTSRNRMSRRARRRGWPRCRLPSLSHEPASWAPPREPFTPCGTRACLRPSVGGYTPADVILQISPCWLQRSGHPGPQCACARRWLGTADRRHPDDVRPCPSARDAPASSRSRSAGTSSLPRPSTSAGRPWISGRGSRWGSTTPHAQNSSVRAQGRGAPRRLRRPSPDPGR